jgi:hypothetical protein
MDPSQRQRDIILVSYLITASRLDFSGGLTLGLIKGDLILKRKKSITKLILKQSIDLEAKQKMK